MSQREGISAPNVAKIMRILRRAGLVTSTRGKAGGYTLARPADEIRVGLDVLGGPRRPALRRAASATGTRASSASASTPRDCSIRPVLRGLQDAVDQVLGELTLASLLGSEGEVAVTLRPRAIKLPMAGRC